MQENLTDQSSRLHGTKLYITLACLSATLFLSFLDQTSVSTALPSIANDLHTGASISWVGTSFLITNTIFQLQYGRISDIFGRKRVLLASIFLLGCGNLLCGFAKTNIQLYVFRSFSGIGSGGITCLVMIVLSDLLTLQERAKYYGIFGVSTALGNGIGPFIGGLLAQKASWKYVFWIVVPLCAAGFVAVWIVVPLKPVTGDVKSKLKLVDWGGAFASLVSILLLLVAVSGGGIAWPWKSALVISMCVISGVAFALFLVVEWRFAILPMIPLYIFQTLPRIGLFCVCFLSGLAYYVDVYYFPVYLQNIRGWSPIVAGALMLPTVASSSVFSILAGYTINRIGGFAFPLYTGGFMWALGSGLKLVYTLDTNPGVIVVVGLIQGCGVGFTFQPTLLALLHNSDKKDRAVVTGLRNFLRCLGGSFGLVISGTVLNNLFQNRLLNDVHDLSVSSINSIVSTPSSIHNMGLNDEQINEILGIYLACMKYVFIIVTVASGLAMLMTFTVKNEPIRDKKPEGEQAENTGSRESDPEKQDSITISEGKLEGPSSSSSLSD